MDSFILFDTKKECLDYYREIEPESSDIDLIRSYHLYEKYSQWFEFPPFTPEEEKELNEMIKADEEYLKHNVYQRQKSLAS